jgi:hypothetical protein
MSFEGVQPIERKEGREKTLLELKNEMQAAMIAHSCSLDDESCIQEWLDKNAENFHFAFDNVSGKYGNLFELWETDRSAVMDNLFGELRDLEGKPSERRAA